MRARSPGDNASGLACSVGGYPEIRVHDEAKKERLGGGVGKSGCDKNEQTKSLCAVVEKANITIYLNIHVISP